MAITSDKDMEAVPSSTNEKQQHQRNGITLIPTPTASPSDPLNWPTSKKLLTLIIVTLAGFIGLAQTVALNSGYFIQAELYGKSATQVSYGTSSGIVGLAVGPLVWAPVAQRLGRCSCIFWGMLLTLICGIWSAVMKKPGDYEDYVISRFFAGLFGSVASAIGAGTIIDIFFLHQRGKAFMFYLATLNLGTVLSPTVSGYIVDSVAWPVQLWWCVGVEGLVAALTFLFLEETSWPRDGTEGPESSRGWLQNRMVTFFPGHRILDGLKAQRTNPLTSIFIGLCPITLLAGLFLTIDYGWVIAQNTLIAVFLQNPVEKGGYGFTPSQNASFNFAQWVGVIASIVYGYFINDRLPLWICKRRGSGVWKLKYRLYPALLPAVVGLPLALGLFGATLQYHLHYMGLAVATFLLNLTVNALTSVVTNYIAEIFRDFASETTTILNFYRLILGLLIPFFVDAWEARVSVGWVFGMMAFFSLGCSAILGVFIWQGESLRALSSIQFQRSDQGVSLKA